MSERCNFIVQWARPATFSRPKVPRVECGKPATHSLPPKHRLILCAEHALLNFGSPAPMRLTDEARAALAARADDGGHNE